MQTYLVPTLISVWILTVPCSWSNVWACPMRRWTSSHDPSVSFRIRSVPPFSLHRFHVWCERIAYIWQTGEPTKCCPSWMQDVFQSGLLHNTLDLGDFLWDWGRARTDLISSDEIRVRDRFTFSTGSYSYSYLLYNMLSSFIGKERKQITNRNETEIGQTMWWSLDWLERDAGGGSYWFHCFFACRIEVK